MLKYNGINYNLDCLLQFQVLKQLLEALAKKQIEYDSILFGRNIEQTNINNHFEKNLNEINENQIVNKENKINNDNNNNYNNNNNSNNKENNIISRKNSENSSKDIGDIIDLYGLKDGIKKNNELILSLSRRIEYLENKSSLFSANDTKDSIKEEIIKMIDNSKKNNQEKINSLKEIIIELNKKAENMNNSYENYLNIIDKNKEELLELIYKNKNDIQKNKELIEELKKSLKEYINSKINQMKYNINVEISKKLEENNENHINKAQKQEDMFNAKIEQLNNQIKEQEKKLFLMNESNTKNSDNFIRQINILKEFKTDQKLTNSKIKSEISNLKLINESFNNNLREINDLLQNNSFQALLSNLNNLSSKIVDVEEYRKTIDLINLHLKELQSDNNQYKRYFEDLLPLIGKITTTEDLKKLEELLKALLEEQNSNAQQKYADKSEILKNIKNITSQIKMLMSKYDKNKEIGENCMFASKLISHYKCASCESYIGDLKNNTQYLPWNKLPMQEMAIKPYRKGNGFSYFLKNAIFDNSCKNLSNFSDDDNNNKFNLNNISIDKIKRKQNFLPSVNNNAIIRNNNSLNNIVEIKAHFNTERDDSSNSNYINSYFTKTVCNNSNNIGSNILLSNIITKYNSKKNKRNNFTSYDNNKSNHIKSKLQEKNNIKFLGIKNNNKDLISPIKKNGKNKNEINKLTYDNLK